jgi:hypothetical protein
VRPEPPEFRLLPQRAGFRLAKKLVVFDVAPANRDLAELVPLAPVGVDRPELPNDVAEITNNNPQTQHSTSLNIQTLLHYLMYVLRLSKLDPPFSRATQKENLNLPSTS